MRHRHALTDEQWNLLSKHLPAQRSAPADDRLFLDAVIFVGRTGIPWRDLPGRFGNWNSVWRRFDRWSKRGVWKPLFEAVTGVLDEEEIEELHLDSTSVKVQISAAGSRRLAGEEKKRPTSVASSAAPAGVGRRRCMPRSMVAVAPCGSS